MKLQFYIEVNILDLFDAHFAFPSWSIWTNLLQMVRISRSAFSDKPFDKSFEICGSGIATNLVFEEGYGLKYPQ